MSSSASTSVSQSKFLVKLPTTGSVSLKGLTWGIAVDVSGSTSTKIDGTTTTVLQTEVKFALSVMKQIDDSVKNVRLIAWDDRADVISSEELQKLTSRGGTYPINIFAERGTLKTMKEVEALILITAGEIDASSVNAFGESIAKNGTHLKVVIGVVVGQPYCDYDDKDCDDTTTPSRTSVTGPVVKRQRTSSRKPETINVSVLLPAMIADSCILYHDSVKTYVMTSAGRFRTALKPVDIEPTTRWDDLTQITPKSLADISISLADKDAVKTLVDDNFIPYGENTFFSPAKMLVSKPSWKEVAGLPFDRISLYFKVSDQMEKLLEWLRDQKTRLFMDLTGTDDKDDFSTIMEDLNQLSKEERKDASNPKVAAFLAARNRVNSRRIISTDENIDIKLTDPDAIKFLDFYKGILDIIEEDKRMIEERDNQSYTMSSVTTSRYTNAGRTKQKKSKDVLSRGSTFTASFSEPHLWNTQFKRLYPKETPLKQECSICTAESIPFVLIRRKLPSETKDLAKDQYNYYYPTLMCGNCADYFCDAGSDPVQSVCFAALPIIPTTNLSGKDTACYLESAAKLVDFTGPSSVMGTLKSLISTPTQLSSSEQSTKTQAVLKDFAKVLVEEFCLPGEKEAIEAFSKGLV
jgi:hypothetical protein